MNICVAHKTDFVYSYACQVLENRFINMMFHSDASYYFFLAHHTASAAHKLRGRGGSRRLPLLGGDCKPGVREGGDAGTGLCLAQRQTQTYTHGATWWVRVCVSPKGRRRPTPTGRHGGYGFVSYPQADADLHPPGQRLR